MNNYGLRSLGYDVISLISSGYTEQLSIIEREASNNTLVNYLREKYKDNMYVFGSDTLPYDVKELNEYFFNLSCYLVANDARRKLGIINIEDGLLAILALILNNYIEREESWNKA